LKTPPLDVTGPAQGSCDVFISYGRDDETPVIRALLSLVECPQPAAFKRGRRVWLDGAPVIHEWGFPSAAEELWPEKVAACLNVIAEEWQLTFEPYLVRVLDPTGFLSKEQESQRAPAALNQKFTFESFIVGACNHFAAAAANAGRCSQDDRRSRKVTLIGAERTKEVQVVEGCIHRKNTVVSIGGIGKSGLSPHQKSVPSEKKQPLIFICYGHRDAVIDSDWHAPAIPKPDLLRALERKMSEVVFQRRSNCLYPAESSAAAQPIFKPWLLGDAWASRLLIHDGPNNRAASTWLAIFARRSVEDRYLHGLVSAHSASLFAGDSSCALAKLKPSRSIFIGHAMTPPMALDGQTSLSRERAIGQDEALGVFRSAYRSVAGPTRPQFLTTNCPSLFRFEAAAQGSWTTEELKHIASCPHCQRVRSHFEPPSMNDADYGPGSSKPENRQLNQSISR
jgi:hypothetical protein